MLDRENVPAEIDYFLRVDLFQPTIEVAAVSAVLSGIICFFIWLFRLPKKRLLRVAFGVGTFILVICASAYVYINRDLTERNIVFDAAG